MDRHWGCHSQPRKDGFYVRTLQFPHDGKGAPRDGWEWMKDTGSKECQYRKATPNDPRCEGCTSP